MSHNPVTDYSVFNPADTSYGTPRTNARGGKSYPILDTNGDALILGTPLMLTWGINRMEDDDTGRVNYNLSLQFPSGDYARDATTEFYQKMHEFQDKILDDAVTYHKEWFNKSKMSREVAEALFYPILKYPKDKSSGEPDLDRSPTIRIKIPYWEGKFDLELYNMNGSPFFTKETDLGSTSFETLIPKKSNIKAAIKCGGVWFAGGKFGVTWKLVQATVRRPAYKPSGVCWLSPSEDDMQLDATLNKHEAEESASAEVAAELMVASTTDVQDSEEEEEEVVAQPPKVKRKRRVVKKKAVEV